MAIFIGLACSASLLMSCSKDPREVAVADFVQTSDNVKTDLSFELVEFSEELGVTAKDSIDLLVAEYNKEYLAPQTLEEYLEQYSRIVDGPGVYDFIIASQAKIDSINAVPKKDSFSNRHIAIYERVIRESHASLKEAKERLAILSRYNSDKKAILCKRVKCKYKIKNPALNNVVQEITGIYYITNDGRKVLAAEKPN